MNLEKFTEDELYRLMNHEGELCVSMYMPTHRAWPESHKNPIRFKNMVKSMESSLREHGLSGGRLESFMEPLEKLNDPYYWEHQFEGLAVFLAEDFFEHYRLPRRFDELLVTGESFHLKPLLPLATNSRDFYLLRLSQQMVKLYACNIYGANEVFLEDAPENLESALWSDDPEKQLQFHSSAPSPVSADRAAIFHGQGVGKDDKKNRVERFLRKVVAAVDDNLSDKKNPLVLAAAEPLLSIYRDLSEYPYIAARSIQGNPEDLSIIELHKKALEVVEPEIQGNLDKVRQGYLRLAGTDKASEDLREIVLASIEGRVDTLFASVERNVWGRVNEDSGAVEIRETRGPGDRDLVDMAAINTLKKGGTVHSFEDGEVHEENPLAAVFRYSTTSSN